MKYEPPKIVELGSIADLTRGKDVGKGKGDGLQKGKGNPFPGGIS